MRIVLHLGPEVAGAGRIQRILSDKREQLAGKGVLYPRSPGDRNHTRLFMAVTDPDHVDPLRANRGFADPARQAALRADVLGGLRREIDRHTPQVLILSAAQLASSVHRRSEMERIRALLAEFSEDISLLALVDDPARLMLAHFAWQLREGRAAPLDRDLGLLDAPDWWQACLDVMPRIDPASGRFEETEGAPFWLDLAQMQARWEEVFGTGRFRFHHHDPDALAQETATDEVRAAFGIETGMGRTVTAIETPLPPAADLARWRQFNALLMKYASLKGGFVPRRLLRQLHDELAVGGPAADARALASVSRRFGPANAALAEAHPGLGPDWPASPSPSDPWAEADPLFGFRASQYLLAFRYRIDKALKSEDAPQPDEPATDTPTGLSEAARAILPPGAVEKFRSLRNSAFAPHNRLGAVDEEQLAATFDPAPMRDLPEGHSGNVIVGCMKNEAPYVVEWVAYHRAIGVDNFLIYTNDCSDGTSEILSRLQQMGVLQHRNNDGWKGGSPQQYALNQALKEPVIRDADWIIHIDVDEFINIRCGNGTLADFFDRVPEATNVAMTWRLFGHNGIARLDDRFVIDQFDACAPKFCPKPHTAWGFKTMFRNIGAYGKISCHRPNKLNEARRDLVRWVNGSGRDMTREAVDNGWRNSKRSIGYDLIQLNHYALRSAESFLIKRQRGRALHVDRSIGLNYWIRMDWCDHRDVTIKRNLPRLRAEYDRLMRDDTLRALHRQGLDWHRAKAAELHGMAEFAELYRQALDIKLTETERVAYALALDMES
ncbi:Glycosyl transferase family 2 [Cribrihabitans marinus]|uniref:Glycosyl transferase family 2 n=1 Tax=Cribrihabitans marinus TaxID=1227549 RepID=A0A1H6R314_9RHOB|nr:glycosyltransferase family 2 protein [Cribrihabitans marinus]GGH20378.1 hypothetical protein GCM10010973_04280 [Cribrihabitans marinus]SEI50239.1 Glycosyl transferase family 2 [Cribrihabitans marinus]